jgi:hypothetical protein
MKSAQTTRGFSVIIPKFIDRKFFIYFFIIKEKFIKQEPPLRDTKGVPKRKWIQEKQHTLETPKKKKKKVIT